MTLFLFLVSQEKQVKRVELCPPFTPIKGFPGGSEGKESSCNAGDLGLIPGLGRSFGERSGYLLHYSWAFLVAQAHKEYAHNVRDLGLIPGLGRYPGEGNGCPLQYSCLENSKDRGAWPATVCGVTKSQTRLSD